MGAFDWSLRPAANASADIDVPALDGTSARDLPGLVRALMAAHAALLNDQGGAIRTAGLANAYLARTASGLSAMRPGIAILVQADRDNTAAPTLNVDSLGARPWRRFDGSVPSPGQIAAGGFYLAVESNGTWVSDFGGVDADAAQDIAFATTLIFGGI